MKCLNFSPVFFFAIGFTLKRPFTSQTNQITNDGNNTTKNIAFDLIIMGSFNISFLFVSFDTKNAAENDFFLYNYTLND